MSDEQTFPRETKAASMASQAPSSDNNVPALIVQDPQEAIQVFRAFPVMARTFHWAELMLRSVGLPPYLPVKSDDISEDQAEAAYSPQPPQPRLGPPPSPPPLLHFPPQVQPSRVGAI